MARAARDHEAELAALDRLRDAEVEASAREARRPASKVRVSARDDVQSPRLGERRRPFRLISAASARGRRRLYERDVASRPSSVRTRRRLASSQVRRRVEALEEKLADARGEKPEGASRSLRSKDDGKDGRRSPARRGPNAPASSLLDTMLTETEAADDFVAIATAHGAEQLAA